MAQYSSMKMDWISVTTCRPIRQFWSPNDEIVMLVAAVIHKPDYRVTTEETRLDYKCHIKCLWRWERFWTTYVRLQEVNEFLLNLLQCFAILLFAPKSVSTLLTKRVPERELAGSKMSASGRSRRRLRFRAWCEKGGQLGKEAVQDLFHGWLWYSYFHVEVRMKY